LSPFSSTATAIIAVVTLVIVVVIIAVAAAVAAVAAMHFQFVFVAWPVNKIRRKILGRVAYEMPNSQKS